MNLPVGMRSILLAERGQIERASRRERDPQRESVASPKRYGCVATTYVAANQALSEVDPGVARLKALLTTLCRGLHVPDLIRVRAVSGEPSEHRVSSLYTGGTIPLSACHVGAFAFILRTTIPVA